MIEDAILLRRYADGHAETDFAEFVRRRVDFVYGCALRRVGGDVQFAEDVTQQVFVTAAREAARLARHPVLSGWLFTTTRNVAARVVRTERRRHAREQEAEAMKVNENDNCAPVGWERIRPVVDDALDRLEEVDRQAVLLRYFEGKSFAEVGARLRLAENTARMRVTRALDKLNANLDRRGISSTAAALVTGLASQAAVVAPSGLAAAATSAAIAGAGTGGATTAAVIFMGMTKLQVGIAAVVLAAGGSGLVLQMRGNAGLRRELTGLRGQLAAGADLAAEQAKLQQARARSDETARAHTAELAALHEQARAMESRLAAARAAHRQAAAVDTVRSATGGSKTLYDSGTLDVFPQPLIRTIPQYPAELRRLGVGGSATVAFSVDREGMVRDARAVSASLPAFGEVAAKAIETWRFKPAQVNGEDVATHLRVPIVFSMHAAHQPPADNEKDAGVDTFVPWF